MADTVQSLNDNLAPIQGITVYAGTISTTVTKIVSGAGTRNRARLVKILNGDDTNRLAFQFIDLDDSAPTLNANFASDAGVILLPETESEWLLIPMRSDVYLVASAADTEYCVSVIDR